MGIRFFCPQGHKLNVKSFLAGKMGICPHCDARVKIPLTSTRPSTKAINRDVEGHAEALPLASPLEDLDQVLEVAEAGLPGTGNSAEALPRTLPESVSADPPPRGSADPLKESPEAQWYVCPEPGGQNYGPATAELMRQWVQEGRVQGEHLVWREGWENWQRAGDCFAHLDNQQPPKAPNAPNGR